LRTFKPVLQWCFEAAKVESSSLSPLQPISEYGKAANYWVFGKGGNGYRHRHGNSQNTLCMHATVNFHTNCCPESSLPD